MTPNQDVRSAARSAKTRKEIKEEELNELTFKSESTTIEKRILRTLNRPSSAHPDPECHAELVESRKTLLVALLIDHLIGTDRMTDDELDTILLDVAKSQ